MTDRRFGLFSFPARLVGNGQGLTSLCTFSILTCFATLLAGCAAQFEGTQYPQVARPSGVRIMDEMPPSHLVIGRVSRSCRRQNGDKGIDGLLMDIITNNVCTEEELVQSLVQGAADAGGNVLSGVACESNASHKRRSGENCSGKRISYEVTVTELTCEAEVGRPRPTAREAALDVMRTTCKPIAGIPTEDMRPSGVRMAEDCLSMLAKMLEVSGRCVGPVNCREAACEDLGCKWL